MKIFYDYQIFCLQKFGGISRYIYELSKHLKCNNLIVAPIHLNYYIKDGKNVKGFYLKGYPKFIRTFLFRINFFLTKFIVILRKPDLIHETYYCSSVISKNIPRVLTVHDMIHELFPQYFNEGDNTSELKRKAVEHAHHIICISHTTKKDLMEIFNIPEKKISVVYHGVNKLISDPNYKCNIDLKFQYLLYVGARNGYKNFKTFLEAYVSNKYINEKYKIVLFGGENFLNDEIEYLNKNEIDVKKVIHLYGSDDVLINLYENAEAFIYPSFYEGFGFPPLEAMTYGCPVIASNASCIPEIVDNAALLFNPNSPEDLSNKLEKILFNECLRQQLIKNGYERIKQFSWEKCAEETKIVYEKVLKQYRKK